MGDDQDLDQVERVVISLGRLPAAELLIFLETYGEIRVVVAEPAESGIISLHLVSIFQIESIYPAALAGYTHI